MKLISFKIKSDFRNLKGLKLSLNEKNDTYVLIGNNGTGKTNILEALSSVFYSLFFKKAFEFSFVLLYKLDDDSYRISHDIATAQTLCKKNDVLVKNWMLYFQIVLFATIVGKILVCGIITIRNLTVII